MLKEKIVFVEDFLDAFYAIVPVEETKARIEQIMDDIDDIREFGFEIKKKENK